MSSHFNNRAAGVQKPPPVCISKLKEQQRVIRPKNTQLALTFDGNGNGPLGPWTLSTNVLMVRPPTTPFWATGAIAWFAGVGYVFEINPEDADPIRKVRIVIYQQPALPIIAAEFYNDLPGYEDDKSYQRNMYDWTAQTTDDRATARMWIS